MVFVIVWFLDHLTLEYVPSMNSIWIFPPVSLFHVWITNFETSLMFFKLSILRSNNVIWVDILAIIFNEAQHLVKISTTWYVPVFYEVITLSIEPQNVLLMLFICKLKGLYLIIFFFNGLLMLSLDLFNSCIKPAWYNVLQMCFLSALPLSFRQFTVT